MGRFFLWGGMVERSSERVSVVCNMMHVRSFSVLKLFFWFWYVCFLFWHEDMERTKPWDCSSRRCGKLLPWQVLGSRAEGSQVWRGPLGLELGQLGIGQWFIPLAKVISLVIRGIRRFNPPKKLGLQSQWDEPPCSMVWVYQQYSHLMVMLVVVILVYYYVFSLCAVTTIIHLALLLIHHQFIITIEVTIRNIHRSLLLLLLSLFNHASTSNQNDYPRHRHRDHGISTESGRCGTSWNFRKFGREKWQLSLGQEWRHLTLQGFWWFLQGKYGRLWKIGYGVS